MKSDKRNLIILAVLGVAVLGVVWFQFMRPAADSGPTTDAVAHTTPQAVQTVQSVFQKVDFDIEELVRSIKEVSFSYAEMQHARDPLAPLIGGSSFLEAADSTGDAAQPPDHDIIYQANRKMVTGIIWDGANPMAVLSEMGEPDEIVTEGYEFGGGVVIKDIEPDHVLFALKLENETMELVKELKEQ